MTDSIQHIQHVTAHTPVGTTGADSVAADSVRALLSHYPELDTLMLQQWAAVQRAQEAQARADSLAIAAAIPPDWTTGLDPQPRTITGINNSGLTAMLVTLILVVILCLRHSRRLFANLGTDLLGLRSRARNFDEHTANESRLMVLFGCQLCIFMGLMLQAAACVHAHVPVFGQSWLVTLCFVGLAGALYLFQLAGYAAVGYAFSTPELSRQWLRGFNASQAILGFAMAIPALVTVFYPDAAKTMIYLALGLYILARLTFIIKGFRIFYTDLASVFYFILYLCALEIIPPLLVVGFSVTIGSQTLL